MASTVNPATEDLTIEETQQQLFAESTGTTPSGYSVILYNCDCHSFDEVIVQVQKAAGCDLAQAESIVVEAHFRGRAICYRGNRDQCHRCARVLREIRLQCEVDCD